MTAQPEDAVTDHLAAQKRLQSEADEIVALLRLDELLSAVGRPVRVGSSAMGLMVRRDIDITVVCPRLDAQALEAFAGIGARLMQATDSVLAVRFRNDAGTWNAEPDKYPDGFYLWLSVRGRDGAMWTVDIWLVDQPERQPDLGHLKTLAPRLTEASRQTILEIKAVLAESEKGPDRVPSALVYEAVLDHGVRTAAEFEAWRLAR